MTNLLPPTYKQKTLRAQWARMIFALAAAAIAVGGIALVSLMPAYFVLSFSGRSLHLSNMTTVDPSTTAAIAETQNMIVAFRSYMATTTPTQLIASALALKPSGVHIDSLLYTADGQAVQLALSGSADKADFVENYRAALVASSTFIKVDVPIGSLIGSPDGRFVITGSMPF